MTNKIENKKEKNKMTEETNTWLKNWVESKSTNQVKAWLKAWVKKVQKLIKGE